jgi:hypothetical protein
MLSASATTASPVPGDHVLQIEGGLRFLLPREGDLGQRGQTIS